jgi:2,5-furandicarboxylate decarboxylase 1
MASSDAAAARGDMSACDLRSFLSEAEAAGERIARVSREVSPVHELPAVVKALEDRGNPIVMFQRVAGSELPVVVGVHGSRRRIAIALGADSVDLVDDYIGRLGGGPEPVQVETGPVRQKRRLGSDADLGDLPIGVHSPEDGGRYITSGVCLARDQESGAINAGIYRTMVKGPRRLTISVDPGQDMDRIVRWGREHGEPVDVAIVIGGHPALAIASQAKVPITKDSLELLCGLLRREVPVVEGETVALRYPAGSEIVIEGRIPPGATDEEGPFGEFSYYYGSSTGAICEVEAILHREDAIYVDLHPTHGEHRCLAIFPGREARLLTALRRALPGVRAVHIPESGAGMVGFVAVEKRSDGDARQAFLLALGTDSMLKHVVVVDADVDVSQPGQVLWALAVRFQADRDLLTIPYAQGFTEDPSSYGYRDRITPRGLVTKTGADATLPLDGAPLPRADLLPEAYRDLDPDDYLDAPAG